MAQVSRKYSQVAVVCGCGDGEVGDTVEVEVRRSSVASRPASGRQAPMPSLENKQLGVVDQVLHTCPLRCTTLVYSCSIVPLRVDENDASRRDPLPPSRWRRSMSEPWPTECLPGDCRPRSEVRLVAGTATDAQIRQSIECTRRSPVNRRSREFVRATDIGAHRLIFVKGTNDARHPKMQALIHKAQAGLIRKRFNTTAEHLAGLYAALVEYLEGKELIRSGPFDAVPCARAALDARDDLLWDVLPRITRTSARERRVRPEGVPDRMAVPKPCTMISTARSIRQSARRRLLPSPFWKCM